MTKTEKKIKMFYAIPHIAFLPSKLGGKVYGLDLNHVKIFEGRVREFRLIEPHGMQVSIYADDDHTYYGLDYSTFKRYCFKTKWTLLS